MNKKVLGMTKNVWKILRSCLWGKAVDFVHFRSKHTKKDYKELVKSLKKRYGHRDPQATIRRTLQHMRQEEGESLEDFADHVYTHVLHGFLTANDDLKNAHVVVRKKSERKKLKGYSCLDCYQYYDSHNLTEEEKAKIIQRCSKHRSTNPPPLHSPNKAPFIIIFL